MTASDLIHAPTMRDIPPEQSLIEYPSPSHQGDGRERRGFRRGRGRVAQQFDPDIRRRDHRDAPEQGRQLPGVTITITATSREQLDELYRTLSTHPMVKVVL